MPACLPGRCAALFGGAFRPGQHLALKVRTKTPRHNDSVNITSEAIKTLMVLKFPHPKSFILSSTEKPDFQCLEDKGGSLPP